ncbi:MAG: LysM peptidoglycan-binding domain-containing protein [Bacteroidia bacterium]|nr:LysM peptidoglycan-binding domain-containing protein [Bacteroidia bacterium]
MVIRFGFKLALIISILQVQAQVDSIGLKLKEIQNEVILEYSEPTAQKINDYIFNTPEKLKNSLVRFFVYDDELKLIFENYNVPIELRYACISMTGCEQNSHKDPIRKGWFNLSYQSSKRHGLFLSNYIDERFDVLKSAQVFCKEIQKIYDRHQNWREALVIFCAGDALWQKAKIISSDSTKDFFVINAYLEQEFRHVYSDYTAAVFAVDYFKSLKIISNDQQEISSVPIDQFVTFSRISSILNINVRQLSQLNPIYKKQIIPDIDRLNQLNIPTTKVDLFYKNRDSLFTESNADSARYYPVVKSKSNEKSISGTVNIIYTVRSGDVLIRIADLYDCNVSQIRKWNNIRGDYLRINQRLIIKKPAIKKAYYGRINRMTRAQKNNIIRKD